MKSRLDRPLVWFLVPFALVAFAVVIGALVDAIR